MMSSLGLALFLAAVAVGLAFTAFAGRSIAMAGVGPWSSVVTVATPLLVAAVAIAFDPGTVDVFNVAKFSMLVVGALALAVLLVGERATLGARLWRRTPLVVPVMLLLGWTAVTTATSVNPRVSVLGLYSSYDGLAAAVAYVVVFLAASRIRADHTRAVFGVLYVAAVVPVAMYALLQLHDRCASGSSWDWVRWSAYLREAPIWSTLGNPNHLAAFLVIALPLGLGLAATTERRAVRVAVGAMSAVMALEVFSTSSRGGWVAAAGAVIIGGGFLFLEVRRSLRVVVAGGTVAAIIALGFLIALPPRLPCNLPVNPMKGGRGGIANVAGPTNTRARLTYWKRAVRIAADRPVTGIGPDAFAVRAPRYVSSHPDASERSGFVITGPHNTWLNRLATEGLPGLVLFGAIVVVAARRVWRTERTLGWDEDGTDPELRRRRILLACVSAGAAAYLAQATVNIEQPALSVMFWFLLGLVAALSPAPDTPPQSRDRAEARGSARTIAIGLATGVAAVGAFFAVRPYLADRPYRRGFVTAAGAHDAPGALASAGVKYAASARWNPWEPTYGDARARALLLQARAATDKATAYSLAAEAAAEEDGALRLRGDRADLMYRKAQALVVLAQSGDTDRRSDLRQAEGLLRRAGRFDPLQDKSPGLLADILAASGRAPEAGRVLDDALARMPKSPSLLKQGARFADAHGDHERAVELWRRVATLKPDDQEARQALAAG